MIYFLKPDELDDETLKEQIEAIAQTLCNVHWLFYMKNELGEFPLGSPHYRQSKERISKIPLKESFNVTNFDKDKFLQWAYECIANYLKLVDMGLACCAEWCYRNSPDAEFVHGGTELHLHRIESGGFKLHKLDSVIEWARNNVPDLPLSVVTLSEFCNTRGATPFPLVMPEKYMLGVRGVTIKDNKLLIDDNNKWAELSYRNYYKSKLPKDVKWTRREKPNWI